MPVLPVSFKPQWRCIGPFRGGRVGAVAGDVSDPTVFYFGACAGGVWKTTDAGTYWVNVSDGFFTTASIGAIAVAESDPNVIYVGSGESTTRSNISPGDGVYKSNDAGRTWQNVGLRDSRHIGKVAIHPQNPDLVYVAALGHAHGPNQQRGVFRSRDGGLSWEQVLHKSDQAGAIDIKLDPNNPRILFAAIWQMERSFYDMSSGGPDSGLYCSFDGGDSWQELTGRNGFPGGLLGKIGVAISPAQRGRVWALVESAEAPGLYRSDDYGANWQLVSTDGELNARAWYYSHITADTQNGDTVYVNCFSFWKSIDGGATFSQIATPHGDNHDLWIDPNNNQRMIQGNDGGACVSLNGGASWSTVFNQPTAQFYRITTDNQTPYHVYGTQQDSSSIAVPSNAYDRGAIPWAACYQAGTGESGHIAVRPDDHNIVYVGAIGSSPGGGNSLQRYDHRRKQIRLISPWPESLRGALPSERRYRWNWTYPILISEHNPDNLYIGCQYVLRSQDEGQSWQEISPDLTRADPATFVASGGPINKEGGAAEMYATVLALAESPLREGLLWAGSDDGLLHLSRDGGASWHNVTSDLWPEFLQISTVEPSPFAEGTVYLAGTRNKANDFRPYLFKSTDYGQSWQEITAGIPDHDFTRVIRADPARERLLYAGSESTVYVSLDDGVSWQALAGNLPIVPVYDLRVKGDDLIAGTHGRSFWILDDLTPLRQLDEAALAAAATLFTPRPALRVRPWLTEDWGGGVAGKNYYAIFAENVTFVEVATAQGTKRRQFLDAGENGPAGALIHYHLAEAPTASISLTIHDGDGNEVNRIVSKGADWESGEFLPAAAGFNCFVWNLRYADGEAIKGKDLSATGAPGPVVAPGRYEVRLTVGQQTLSQPLTVVLDGRVETPVAELEAQVSLLLTVRDKLSEAHALINDVRDVRAQLAAWQERLADRPELADAAGKLAQKLHDAEEPLIMPGLKTRSEVGNAGVRLLAQLAAFIPLAGGADYGPTSVSQPYVDHLVTQIDDCLATLHELLQAELPHFNNQLHAAGLGAVMP